MSVRFWRKGGEKPPTPQYYRCMTCGNLLGGVMISEGVCAGHKMQYATTGTWWEYIKILFGVIK